MLTFAEYNQGMKGMNLVYRIYFLRPVALYIKGMFLENFENTLSVKD